MKFASSYECKGNHNVIYFGGTIVRLPYIYNSWHIIPIQKHHSKTIYQRETFQQKPRNKAYSFSVFNRCHTIFVSRPKIVRHTTHIWIQETPCLAYIADALPIDMLPSLWRELRAQKVYIKMQIIVNSDRDRNNSIKGQLAPLHVCGTPGVYQAFDYWISLKIPVIK